MATRVATAYVEISAKFDADDIANQLRDALNKAGTTTARSAGQQMGKDLSTGIQEGITKSAKTVPGTGTKTIPGLDEALRGANVKKVGQQVGKDLAAGISEGWGKGGPGGGVGKQLGKDIAEGTGGILESATKEMLRDWADHFKNELKKGDVKSALNEAGTAAANASDMVANIGEKFGANTDSIRNFGDKVATTLDHLGGTIQPVIDKFKTTADNAHSIVSAMSEMGSGDAATRIHALGDALGAADDAAKNFGVDISGITEPLQGLAGTAEGIAGIADSLKGLGAGLGVLASPEVLAVLAALAAIGGAVALPAWLAQPEQQPKNWPVAPEFPTTPGAPQGQPQIGPFPVVPQLPPSGPPKGYWPGFGTVGGYGVPGSEAAPSLGGPMAPSPLGQLAPVDIGGLPPARAPAPAAPPPAAPTAGAVDIHSNTASVSIGSASVSIPNLSLPSAAAAAAPGGSGVWWGAKIGSRQTGGPITQDELAKLHAGEHVLTAPDVHAMGGQDAVSDFRDQLGRAGGPPGGAEAAGLAGQGVGDALESMRTAGFVPAAAGQQTVAGTSFVAGMLNLGNEAVGGLIDAGAAAAQQAASMAASAGSFGAGGAAGGAAAGIGIQMAANEAKRAATYGFQLASIGADALIEQMFPFGAPRWIGYDYTKFMPHINVGSIATTSVEKAMAAQQGKTLGPGQQPGGPVAPGQLPGMAGPGAPSPKFGEHTRVPAPEGTPPGLGEAGQVQAGIQAGLGGAAAPAPAAPTVEAPPPPPPPSAPAQSGPGAASSSPFSSLFQQFDEGGWLMPNQPAINTTSRPELVLSPQQLDAAKGGWGRGDTYHITAVNAEDVAKQIDTRKRLSMMRYSSRP